MSCTVNMLLSNPVENLCVLRKFPKHINNKLINLKNVILYFLIRFTLIPRNIVLKSFSFIIFDNGFMKHCNRLSNTTT